MRRREMRRSKQEQLGWQCKRKKKMSYLNEGNDESCYSNPENVLLEEVLQKRPTTLQCNKPVSSLLHMQVAKDQKCWLIKSRASSALTWMQIMVPLFMASFPQFVVLFLQHESGTEFWEPLKPTQSLEFTAPQHFSYTHTHRRKLS